MSQEVRPGVAHVGTDDASPRGGGLAAGDSVPGDPRVCAHPDMGQDWGVGPLSAARTSGAGGAAVRNRVLERTSELTLFSSGFVHFATQ